MTPLSGSDADHVFHGVDEDDAVTLLSGPGGFHDGVDRFFHVVLAQDDVHLDLRQEIHPGGGDTPRLVDPSLPSVTSNIEDVHAHDADITQALLHSLQRVLTDDRLYFLGQRLSPFSGSKSEARNVPLPGFALFGRFRRALCLIGSGNSYIHVA